VAQTPQLPCGVLNNHTVVVPTDYPPAILPPVGGVYIDPWTNCPSTRLANGLADGNSGEHIEYANIPAISYDDQYVLLKREGTDRKIVDSYGNVIVPFGKFPRGGTNDATLSWAGPAGSAGGLITDGHTLINIVNNPADGPVGILGASILPTDTTITLQHGTGMGLSVGSGIIIDSEQMTVTTVISRLSLVVTRGANSTVAASHTAGAFIQKTAGCRWQHTCVFKVYKLTFPTTGCAPNCSVTTTLIFDASSLFNVVMGNGMSSGFVTWGDEGGGLSPDFNHLILFGSISFAQQREKICSLQLNPALILGCADLSAYMDRNNAMYTGPSNRIAMQTCTDPNDDCGSTNIHQSEQQVWLWAADLSSHTVITNAWNVHSQYMGDGAGHEYGFYASTKGPPQNGPPNACAPSPKGLYRIDVDDPTGTVFCVLRNPDDALDVHVSTGGGAAGWILYSTEYLVNLNGVGNCATDSYPLSGIGSCSTSPMWTTMWSLYHNENVVANLDGSNIYDVNVTRSFLCKVGDPNCNATLYWALPFGSLSRSGKMIAYDSDLGNHPSAGGYSDAWIVPNPGTLNIGVQFGNQVKVGAGVKVH
jgi:hypothetical protein